MSMLDKESLEAYQQLDVRSAFSKALFHAAQTRPTLCALTADLAATCRLEAFQSAFPERFYNVGIAEGAMVSVAAGLAHSGQIPFATTFAFCAMRAAEQIRTDLAYGKANVKFVGYSAGVSNGILGNSHYALEDTGMLRPIAGLTIVEPADNLEILQAVEAVADYQGAVYFRLTGATLPPLHRGDYRFSLEKMDVLRQGTEVALLACGSMVAPALEAAEKIAEEGRCSVAVVNVHTIKPLDEACLGTLCKTAKLLVTVEEHTLIGGLGSAVCEVAAQLPGAPPVLRLALPDCFGPIGSYEEQLERYGLTANQLARAVLERYRLPA